MSVSLYLDHHVKRAIAEGLRARGVDVITCFEDATERWTDEQLLARARDLKRAIFTQDDDFLQLGHLWLLEGRAFSGIIFAPQTRITIGQAIHDLELIAKVMDAEDMKNNIEYLPFD